MRGERLKREKERRDVKFSLKEKSEKERTGGMDERKRRVREDQRKENPRRGIGTASRASRAKRLYIQWVREWTISHQIICTSLEY